MSYEWKTNTGFEGLKLENLENVIISPTCDSQTTYAYTGGQTRAKVAATI